MSSPEIFNQKFSDPNGTSAQVLLSFHVKTAASMTKKTDSVTVNFGTADFLGKSGSSAFWATFTGTAGTFRAFDVTRDGTSSTPSRHLRTLTCQREGTL